MSKDLTETEFNAISTLSAQERYDYFIEKAVANSEVWSLQSAEGWVTMSSEDGEECFPVWPHREFAAQWVTDDWANCTPTAISLDAWTERWIPGMEKDGTLLAVFPNDDGEGDIVTPMALLASIDIMAR